MFLARHPDTTPEGWETMQADDRPFPSDAELIGQLEASVYHVRLAAKSGASTDLHMSDMRPVVLLRLLKLAIVCICSMADVKKMSHGDLRTMFAEMRVVEKRSR